MAKRYIKPGAKITVHHVHATVGHTGTVLDLNFDWSTNEMDQGCDEGTIGSIEQEGERGQILEFPVYRDQDTGLLWYDDERGR